MWKNIILGPELFKLDEELIFELSPSIPSSWFREDGTIEFKLFSKIKGIYYTKDHQSSDEKRMTVEKYKLIYDNETVMVEGPVVKGISAYDIRACKVKEIHVYL